MVYETKIFREFGHFNIAPFFQEHKSLIFGLPTTGLETLLLKKMEASFAFGFLLFQRSQTLPIGDVGVHGSDQILNRLGQGNRFHYGLGWATGTPGAGVWGGASGWPNGWNRIWDSGWGMGPIWTQRMPAMPTLFPAKVVLPALPSMAPQMLPQPPTALPEGFMVPSAGIDNTITVGACMDTSRFCKFWASRSECENNPFYMRTQCPVACNSCGVRFEDINRPGLKHETGII